MSGLDGIEISDHPRREEIFTPEATAFVADLVRTFRDQRIDLLRNRRIRQEKFDSGLRPDFLPETAEIRSGTWTVAPPPKDLMDRRVEITGPPERKMMINALNSGARVFMADFEDSSSPTWDNMMEGQLNVRDAIRRDLSLRRSGKS
jgi:malate synthase